MNKTTLQVPVDKSLKFLAEKEALKQGFSSLQEAIRVFMAQFATRHISISFTKPEDETLTLKEENALIKKYKKTKKEIANGSVFAAESVEEMMKQLHS